MSFEISMIDFNVNKQKNVYEAKICKEILKDLSFVTTKAGMASN